MGSMNLPHVTWAPSQSHTWLNVVDETQFPSFSLSQVPHRVPSEWESQPTSSSSSKSFAQPNPDVPRPSSKKERRREASLPFASFGFASGQSLIPAIAAVSRQCDLKARAGGSSRGNSRKPGLVPRTKSLPASAFSFRTNSGSQNVPAAAPSKKPISSSSTFRFSRPSHSNHPDPFADNDDSSSDDTHESNPSSSASLFDHETLAAPREDNERSTNNTPHSSADSSDAKVSVSNLNAIDEPSSSAQRMPPPPPRNFPEPGLQRSSSSSRFHQSRTTNREHTAPARNRKRALASPQTSPSRPPPPTKKVSFQQHSLNTKQHDNTLLRNKSPVKHTTTATAITATATNSSSPTSSKLPSFQVDPGPKTAPTDPDADSLPPSTKPLPYKTLGMRPRPTHYQSGSSKPFKPPLVNESTMDFHPHPPTEPRSSQMDHPETRNGILPGTGSRKACDDDDDDEDMYTGMDSFDMDELEELLKKYDT